MSNLRFSQIVILVLVICLVLTGCLQRSVTNKISGTGWFADQEWLAKQIPQDFSMVSPADVEGLSPGTDITLYFGRETISGQDGCNYYRAHHTISGEQIVVSDFETLTKLDCDQWVDSCQELFMKALLSATMIKRANSKLELLDNQGLVLLKFNEIIGKLAGTSWVVKLIGNEPVLEDATAFFAFGVDGRLWGNTGCNTFNFSYHEGGINLLLSEGSIYEVGCASPKGITYQENRMLELLRKVAAYEMVGDVLLLKDVNGSVIFESVRR